MSIHFFCRSSSLPLITASTYIGLFGTSAALHYIRNTLYYCWLILVLLSLSSIDTTLYV